MCRFLCFLVILIAIISTSCGDGKTHALSLIGQAKEAIDQGNYDQALSLLNQISPNTEEVVLLKVSAYGGKAGFRLLSVLDQFSTTKALSDPLNALFSIARIYTPQEINSSRSGIGEIEQFAPQIMSRSAGLNARFALLEIYKASQILLNDADITHSGSGISTSWQPCSDQQLPILDAREVIVSLNKAMIAINRIRQLIQNDDLTAVYNVITKIQIEVGVNPQNVDDDQLSDSDANKLRTYLNQSLLHRSGVCAL